MKLCTGILAIASVMLCIGIPYDAIAAEATYKQKRQCWKVPGSEARSEYYGFIKAAGQTIYLSRDFDAKGPTQKCGYVTDYSEREITNPSKFSQ